MHKSSMARGILLGAGAAWAIVLAGCAHYAPAPISPTDTMTGFAARRLDDGGLRAFVRESRAERETEWPPPAWGFDELTLVALYYHPSLEVWRAAVNLADARRITAGERPNPAVDEVAQYNATSAGIPAWILGSTFNLPLETAGKRRYRIANARLLAQAARWELAAAAWRVRRRLRSALLDLYEAIESERLLVRGVAVQARLANLLEQARQAGAVAGVQVTRERIALDRQRLELRRARAREALARTAVAEALGVGVEALEGVRLRFDEFATLPPPLPARQARTRALLNRPDLLAGLATYAAAESALQLAVAQQYPDLRLGPGYEFDQGDGKWTLGWSISLPIFHRNAGRVAEARARRAQAGAKFLELQARVIAQVTAASAAVVSAREEVRVAARTVRRLLGQQRVTAARHRAGELAGDAPLRARLELLAGRTERLAARIRLQRAAGGLEDAMQTRMKLSPELLGLARAAAAR